MAHELELDRAGRASFCYRKANGNPWHRLGHGFDRPPTFIEAIEAANMDRLAYLEPITTVSGLPIEDRVAVVYPTVEGVERVTSVVSTEYGLVQYPDVVELALAVVGGSRHHALLDTLGKLFDGKRMFGFIDFGDVESVLPNGAVDRAFKGLGFMSSHDASQSITFWLTIVRAVCNNTVEAGIASAGRIVRVRHTAKAAERMAEVPRLLDLAYGGDKDFTLLARSLGQVEGGHDLLDKVIERVWPKPPPHKRTDRGEKIAKNRREALHELFEAPSNAGGFGANGWSVYNTVAEFLDHWQGDADVRARAAIDPTSSRAARKLVAAQAVLA